MDGSDISQTAIRLVRAKRPAYAAADGFLDFQRWPALRTVEQPARQRHGLGGRHRLLSLGRGGIGQAQSARGERNSDVPTAQSEIADRRELYYGRRTYSQRLR